jgi:Ssp1 endopeptidase immunity protein Rap1a
MKTSIVSASILLLLISGEAMGLEFGTANEMMPGCRAMLNHDQRNILRQGECIGAVAAITHIDLAVCPPKDSNVEQAIRIVVQYIDSKPARLQENFYDLAVEALRAAWRGLCH